VALRERYRGGERGGVAADGGEDRSDQIGQAGAIVSRDGEAEGAPLRRDRVEEGAKLAQLEIGRAHV